jgi:hypothetical protein
MDERSRLQTTVVHTIFGEMFCHARRNVAMYFGSTSSARRDVAPTRRYLGPLEGDELRMNWRNSTHPVETISFTYIKNSIGPRMDPCGTPFMTLVDED